MTDREQALELVHAEIDGVLESGDRARLHRTLLQDPALRRLRDELRRTCAALDALPFEEPPSGLHSTIMESLPAPPPACQDRDVHLSGRNDRPAWRYAAALAGGLLVSVLAFQLATDGTRLDSGELTGTIAATNPARLELRLDQARGIIEVGGTTVAPTVQAHLVTRAPIAVIARVGGQEVQLGGFATDGTLSERHASFARGAGSPPTIVEIIVVDRSSGSVLRTAQLRVDATD